jgi:two-component system, sensor histidine kinase PdtaS
MKKLIFIIFLYIAIHGVLNGQNQLPDSIIEKLSKINADSDKVEMLIKQGDVFYQQYNTEGFSKAAFYYGKAREIANKTTDSVLIGTTYHSLGQVYDAIGDDKLPRALEYYKIFEKTCLKQQDTTIILRSIINVAHTQMRLKEKVGCLQSLQKLASLAAQYGKIKSLNRAYVTCAYLSSQIGEFASSRFYFNKINQTKDTILNGSLSFKNWFHLTKVILYGAEQNFEKAIAAGKEGMYFAMNASDSLFFAKNIADYAEKGNLFEEAVRFRNIELDLFANITKNNGLTATNNALLKSELTLKEEKEALRKSKDAVQRKYTYLLAIAFGISLLVLLGIMYLAIARLKQNKLLAEKVAENELLLKEMHHRVKNNLQIVNSYLLLEEGKENTPKEFLHSLQAKIHAMALLHQKLHTQDTYNTIDIQEYFKQLATKIVEPYKDNAQKIEYIIDAVGIVLPHQKLATLGLVVTELLLNSIKHVAMHQHCIVNLVIQQQQDTYIITYLDNGMGLPNNIQLKTASSTGLLLIKQFVKQLGAQIKVINLSAQNGFEITMPLYKK